MVECGTVLVTSTTWRVSAGHEVLCSDFVPAADASSAGTKSPCVFRGYLVLATKRQALCAEGPLRALGAIRHLTVEASCPPNDQSAK
jgi:hypothetical protein